MLVMLAVVALKEVTACPAGTVTVAGAVSMELVLASVMTAPPAGAD